MNAMTRLSINEHIWICYYLMKVKKRKKTAATLFLTGASAQQTLLTDNAIYFPRLRRKEGARHFAPVQAEALKWAVSHMHTRTDPSQLAAADDWQNSVYRPGSHLYPLAHLSGKAGLKCSRLLLYFCR